MPAIQLTRARTEGLDAGDKLRELAAQFARLHCVHLPRLLDPSLLTVVQQQLDDGAFFDRRDRGDDGHEVARELTLIEGPAVRVLQFLVNDPALFSVVRAVTGCAAITFFDGRIYRLPPSGGYFDSWHDDIADQRMIGMSLNLSPEPYTGGVFQIREAGSASISELPNTGPGDAILFRINNGLQHQVTPVTGAHAKTAFAGWFCGAP